MFKFFLINMFLVFNFIHILNADTKTFDFTDSNDTKTITVVITDEDWQHINEGEKTANGFLGGHNWDLYFKKYIKNNPKSPSVFFDRLMNCYIVESEKGFSLQKIIANLNADINSSVKYHSLFPKEVLNKDLIFRAFEKAFRESNDHNIKESKIAYRDKIFYTTIDNLKVAGIFENNKKNKNRKNTYTIKTFFPDVYWHYRLDIKDRPKFSIDRFMELSENQWLCYDNTLLSNNKYQYEPIKGKMVFLENYFYNLENDKSFVNLGLKIREAINGKLQNYQDINILEYFFKDPLNHTEYEWNNMNYFINFYTKFKYNKNKKFNLFKIAFNKYINGKNINLIRFYSKDKKYIISEEKIGDDLNGRYLAKGLSFAEELLSQILIIDTDPNKMIDIDTTTTFFKDQLQSDKIREVTKYFVNNFLNKILGEDLSAELKREKLSFNLRLLNKKYMLELINPDELTREVISKSSQQSYLIISVIGHDSFSYKLSLSQICY